MSGRFGIIALSVVLLGGCHAGKGGLGPRELVGSLAGAVGGALAAGKNVGRGSGRALAAGAGALIGYGIGADVGRSLDRANRLCEARPEKPVGHSQQTPVPGFDHPSRRGGAVFGGEAEIGPSIRDAGSCRSLEGGLRPSVVCRNEAGQWFVLQ